MPGIGLHGGFGGLGRSRGELFPYTFFRYFSSGDRCLPKINFGASLKSIFFSIVRSLTILLVSL